MGVTQLERVVQNVSLTARKCSPVWPREAGQPGLASRVPADVTAALDSLLTGNGRDPNHRHSLPPLGPRLAARGKGTVEP